MLTCFIAEVKIVAKNDYKNKIALVTETFPVDFFRNVPEFR